MNLGLLKVSLHHPEPLINFIRKKSINPTIYNIHRNIKTIEICLIK